MRSLLHPAVYAQTMDRVRRLEPGSRRRWGRMSVQGMMCHLADAYDLALGVRPTDRRPRLHERTLLRFVALHAPVRWPHGIRSVPVVDQEVGGTPPEDFERDRTRLEASMVRFVDEIQPATAFHPIFGRLSEAEWGRWGFRHADHHLRQFGA